MRLRYRARERHFLIACLFAGVACVGTWITAVRFEDAWTARREVKTSEAILDSCQRLPARLRSLSDLAERYLAAGTTVNLMTFRVSQEAWQEEIGRLWNGVRMDPNALMALIRAQQLVQRWQDRTVEARLAGVEGGRAFTSTPSETGL